MLLFSKCAPRKLDMDYRLCFLVLSSVVIIPVISVSVQDGFNYFKALNRTPFSRAVRVYGYEFPKTFKVPLTVNKRIPCDGSDNEEGDLGQRRLSSPSENDTPLVLMHWLPYKFKSQRDSAPPVERNAKQYAGMRDTYYEDES